jgi:2'-5' RNA ligase
VTLALDIAFLLPDDAAGLAVELNRRLDDGEAGRLRLDATHLPHLTLVQLFARDESLRELCGGVDAAAAAFGPLSLRVRGVDESSPTAMLVFDEDERLRELHDALMDAVRGFEARGGPDAFFTEGDLPARDRDVAWVSGYRAVHSGENFHPHVTVGHGRGAGPVEPFAFRADRLAVCHLGRHCTCRRILHERRL